VAASVAGAVRWRGTSEPDLSLDGLELATTYTTASSRRLH
jgi:hypothetical protein